jgi:hypothetical protein
MSLSITLFHFESADIKIDIEARFEGEALVVDGYDVGKRVEEYWGSSDYEYTVTVPQSGVALLYSLLEVVPDDKQALLNEIAKRYSTNSCYSQFREFLDHHQIPSSGFSWP